MPYAIAAVTSANPSVAFSDSSPFRGALWMPIKKMEEHYAAIYSGTGFL